MCKTAVVIINENCFKAIEEETARSTSRHLLLEAHGKQMDLFQIDKNKPLTISDLKPKDYDVFVFISGIVFITHKGIAALSNLSLIRKEFSIIAPVSNLSNVLLQRQSPPFFYQTLTVFRWAAEKILMEFQDTVVEADEIDDFCFALKKEMLQELPASLSLYDLHHALKEKKIKQGIAKGVYVHRYGNVYESGRDDLLQYVPLDAQNILDVGCARGLTGELIKKRQRGVVTGVEMDTEMAVIAASRLDNVINGDIEELIGRGNLGLYDCIMCGDVLEHLNNPWKVVKGLKSHLKKKGIFIASTPNIMNWAIIYEQLNGRWDYVPFTILSGEHVRFFTKDTCREMFECAGYKIRAIHLQSFGIPPKGTVFIENLKKAVTGINEEELHASEIVVVAEG